MFEIRRIENPSEFGPGFDRAAFVDFLYTSLGRWSDPPEEIDLAIDYAFSDDAGRGGFLLAALAEGELAGGVVINRTGMTRYVPENLLVYIAVGDRHRNLGLGRRLVEAILGACRGSVALHCEPDNPALRLYERLGFTAKYVEMRHAPDANA